jgi:hypothetical protein
VRVWSTMNSPQPFALAMMAGLLFAFAAKGPFRFIAGAPGYVSLLLSLARTAWLGWVIGVIVLMVRARGVQRMRLLAVGMLVCLLSLPLLLLEPVADRVAGRFATMQQIEEDNSLHARLAIYSNFFLTAANNVVGEGIGSTSKATKLTNDEREITSPIADSGVLELPFTLGWPGSMLYLGGLTWLVAGALSGRAQRMDFAAQAAAAVVCATLAAMLSYNTLIGAPGMVFWSFLGLALSARAFQGEQPKRGYGRSSIDRSLRPLESG